uniref:Variant surface glycoprotein 1125.414 n=1 Tax=Trypanosoma brucei TaxID=5691 RepID=A0A1J0R5S6_9TRYP|nr:variant surface glycoprotein 1125.414 [Trypanosoma brucei]
MWSLAALITAIAISNAQRGESTHKKPLKVAAMQKVCHLSLEMTKVPAYVANRLQQLGREAAELQELQQILLTAVLPTDGAVDEEMSTLLLLADKLGVETARKIQSAAEKAVLTGGRCAFYAGRVHEFVSVFFQSMVTSTKYCIKGVRNEAKTSELACISDNKGSPSAVLTTRNPEKPDVSAKSAALRANATDLNAETAEADCGLTMRDSTDGGYIDNQNIDQAIHWGGELFRTSTGSAATQTNWQTNTAPTVDDSTYQECSKHLAEIVAQLKSAEQADKLLLLLESENTAWQELKIKAKSVADKYPEKEITVKANKLKSIHETIKKFKQANLAANKIEQPAVAATLSRITLNETACQLAAALGGKEGCQVTKAEAAKCEDKGQAECGTTKGCEWNKTEEKCKITEDAQKDAEKANQEAGGKDGKPDCKKHGTDKNACEKDNNCKWENNVCKDSSFPLNKKLDVITGCL